MYDIDGEINRGYGCEKNRRNTETIGQGWWMRNDWKYCFYRQIIAGNLDICELREKEVWDQERDSLRRVRCFALYNLGPEEWTIIRHRLNGMEMWKEGRVKRRLDKVRVMMMMMIVNSNSAWSGVCSTVTPARERKAEIYSYRHNFLLLGHNDPI